MFQRWSAPKKAIEYSRTGSKKITAIARECFRRVKAMGRERSQVWSRSFKVHECSRRDLKEIKAGEDYQVLRKRSKKVKAGWCPEG
jgi:hypothetical protein